MRTLVKLTQELVGAAEQVVKLERLLLGESTENHAHAHAHTFETRDDAMLVIERANAAMRRMKGDVIDVVATDVPDKPAGS